MNAQTEIAVTAGAATMDLWKALDRVKTVVRRRNTIPVLGMVLVDIADGHCTVHATDLDMWPSAGCAAEGKAKFLIQPRLPEHMLRHGGPTVQIVQGKDRVEIRTGDLTGRFNLICNFSDWPTAGAAKFGKAVTMEGETLRRAIDALTPSISTEETRYYLNGAFFEPPKEGGMRMVSTDGHRLALYEIEGQDWPFPAVIIPRAAVAWLRRELKGVEQVRVSHCADRNMLRLACDAWHFKTKLIDGAYPDYRRVIPKPDGKISVAVSGDALAAMPLLSPHTSPGLKIDPESGRMTVSAPDCGEASIPVTGTGPAFGVNLHYLRQFCPRGEAVRIEGTSPRDPMLIIGADASLTRVLMPLRV